MKRTLLTATLVCVFVQTACTSAVYLRPVVHPGQEIETIFWQGRELAISHGERTTVAVFGMKTEENELLLHVLYQNRSAGTRMDVIPEKIGVEAFDEGGQSKRLGVFSAERYMRKKRNAQQWALAAQAFAGAMQAVSAGRTTSYTQAYAYGTGGYAWGSATTTTYDAAKAAQVSALNQAQLERNAQRFAQTNATVEGGLLKKNTLFPGQTIEGNVMAKYNGWYSAKFLVAVPIGGEVHVFTLVPETETMIAPFPAVANEGNAYAMTVGKETDVFLGPGDRFELLGSLPPGTTIRVVDRIEGWVRFSNSHFPTGWVREGAGIQDVDDELGGPSAAESVVLIPATVFAGPGGVNRQLGSLQKGESIQVHETKNGWYRFTSSHYPDGWVHGTFIKEPARIPRPPQVSSPETNAPEPATNREDWRLSY